MTRRRQVTTSTARLVLFVSATLFNAMTPGMGGLTLFLALATLPVAYHLFKTLDTKEEPR